MKLGIDYLGVLGGYGAYPQGGQRYAEIIRALLKDGHEVCMITGVSSEGRLKHRKDFLKEYDLDIPIHPLWHPPEPDDAVIVELGRQKGRICLEQGVDMIIEDDPRVVQGIREADPHVMILRALLETDDLERGRNTWHWKY